MRQTARVVLAALPCTSSGVSHPDRSAGTMRPPGFSPLPLRPLRLSPITATAGGRPSVTPGTGLRQLATGTSPTATGAGTAPSSQRSSMKPGKITRKSAPRHA
jgi:hypothetical protein